MSRTLLVICLNFTLAFTCKNSHTLKEPNSLEDKQRKTELFKIISTHSTQSSVFAITIDTVYTITPIAFKNDTNYLAITFSPKPALNNDLATGMRVLSSFEYPLLAQKINAKSLHFLSIGKPEITYASISSQLQSKISQSGKLLELSRIQLFDSLYYLIDKNSSALYIYNPEDNRLDSIKFKHKYFEILNFTISDMLQDGQPELTLFHIGERPEENVVSIDMYIIK